MRHILPPLLRPRVVVARFSANQPPGPPPDQPPPNQQPPAQDQNQRRQTDRSVSTGVIIAIILLLLLACVALAVGVIIHNNNPSPTVQKTPTASPNFSSTPSPTVTTTPTPCTASTPPQPGLCGAYYQMPTVSPGSPVPALSSGSPVFTATDFTANETNFPATNNGFDIPYGVWGATGTQHYPHPELGSLGPNGFGVRWTGLIEPTQSGTYTFYTISDDGVRVWVNGQLMVDNWTSHAQSLNCSAVAAPETPVPGPSSQCTTIALTAGHTYSLKVEYYENNQSGATIQLYWQTAQMGQKQIVPDSVLFH